MSADEIRRKACEAQAIPRDERRFTPDGKVHLDPDDTEALCDLADRAYEAASHLRDRERADYADGYYTSSTLSGRHAAELEDCLAHLDGETDG